jgi:cytosine/adenosine deaminase-related metal-dependent hydrolase
VCIGTDSHARIDVVDELRSLEDHERLRTERRNVLLAEGQRLHHALLPAGTRNGLRSLMLLENEEALADRVHVTSSIEGRAGGPHVAADAWLVGGSGRDVQRVLVGPRSVVELGHLVSADQGEIEEKALAVLKRLTN